MTAETYEAYKRRELDALCRDLGKTPEQIAQFKADIRAVCVRHGLSISHEDGHGALEPFSEHLMQWFENASGSEGAHELMIREEREQEIEP